MKQFVKLAAATAVLAALSAPAYANEVKDGDTYFKLSGGALIVDDLKGTAFGLPLKVELDTGWTVSGAIGYHLNPNVALELELSYVTADFDSATIGGAPVTINGDISSFLTLVNAVFHVNPGGNFDPYFGAGIGAAFSEIKIDSLAGIPINSKDSTDDLALQGTAGVNMALGSGKLGAQYRYLWTDTGGNGADDVTGHALTLHYILPF